MVGGSFSRGDTELGGTPIHHRTHPCLLHRLTHATLVRQRAAGRRRTGLLQKVSMSIIEFQTYIDHGTIELPKEYHDRIKGRARIIILTDEGEDDEDMVEFLLDHPYHIDAFTPLTRDEIYERR
jgi:hypothetical protein